MYGYARANREAAAFGVRVEPSRVREASLAPRPPLPRAVKIAAFIPFVLLGLMALYLHLNWDAIPERFPIHWNVEGEIDNWADKSIGSAYGMLGVAAGIGLFIACLIPIVGRARRVYADGPQAKTDEEVRQWLYWILIAVQWLGVLSMAGIHVFVLLRDEQGMPKGLIALLVIGTIVFSLAMVIVVVALVQRRSSRETSALDSGRTEDPGAPIGDRTLDRYWKWGMFYINPEDPAVWVEKRFGLGWTLNLGQRGAWWWIAALVVFLVVLSVVPIALFL